MGISNLEWRRSKFVGLAYQQGKDIVFRFIIEYIVALGILAPTE